MPHVEDTNGRGKSPAPPCQHFGQQRRRRQTGKSTLRLVSRPSCCIGGCEDGQAESARCPAKRHAQEVNADETPGLQSSESERESSHPEDVGASDVDEEEDTQAEQPVHSWSINVLAAAESPDPRRRVEDAMRRVAMAMRPSPTLPPNIEDPSAPCPDAD